MLMVCNENISSPARLAGPEHVFLEAKNAGGGIRTHEPLRDEVLSLAPLTRLGDPRRGIAGLNFKL